MKLGRNESILFFIIGLAVLLRFYRLDDLAVFLADQASDSSAVLNMTRGHLTLLGPITSVGGFYNGPIVYYLMLPFYFLLKSDPISGTVFQSIMSVATIPLLYLIGKKLVNNQVGLITAFLFAISPLMIDYSRAAFNAYPAIFFSTLIIYLFIKTVDYLSLQTVLFLGVLIGFILQMHYLAISFLILVLIYPLLFEKALISYRYYFMLLIGMIIGLAPFLFFELRHHFLNSHLFIKYLLSSKNSVRSPIFTLQIWPQVSGLLLFGENVTIGGAGIMITAITTVLLYIKNKVNRKYLMVFILLWIVVFVVGLVYGRRMHDHYIISFHTSLIILYSLAIYYVSNKKTTTIFLLCLIFLLINSTHWNLDRAKHPLQDGLSIADFKKAADIIKKDGKGKYNVGMHAQGDNRAMPLRYVLNLLNETPAYYDNYSSIDNLYLLVKEKEPVTSLKMWEYTSFGRSIVMRKWQINGQYFLYKLVKD